jgi:hypothetical protein
MQFFYVNFTMLVCGWEWGSLQADILVQCSAWIPNTDLTPLDPESCKNVTEKGKSKNLIAAYHIASENHDLQYFKDMLAEHQRAMQEDLEEREARAAAKAAKEEKKKRKSMEVADDQEDEEMAEVGEEKRKSAKKRKKEVESDGESEKVSMPGKWRVAIMNCWCLGAAFGGVFANKDRFTRRSPPKHPRPLRS